MPVGTSRWLRCEGRQGLSLETTHEGVVALRSSRGLDDARWRSLLDHQVAESHATAGALEGMHR